MRSTPVLMIKMLYPVPFGRLPDTVSNPSRNAPNPDSYSHNHHPATACPTAPEAFRPSPLAPVRNVRFAMQDIPGFVADNGGCHSTTSRNERGFGSAPLPLVVPSVSGAAKPHPPARSKSHRIESKPMPRSDRIGSDTIRSGRVPWCFPIAPGTRRHRFRTPPCS